MKSFFNHQIQPIKLMALISQILVVSSCGISPRKQNPQKNDQSIATAIRGTEGQTTNKKVNNETQEAIYYDQEIRDLFELRCSECHNSDGDLPNWLDYSTAYSYKQKIRQKVFVEQSMPEDNITDMTEAERERVALWVDQGALKNPDSPPPSDGNGNQDCDDDDDDDDDKRSDFKNADLATDLIISHQYASTTLRSELKGKGHGRGRGRGRGHGRGRGRGHGRGHDDECK